MCVSEPVWSQDSKNVIFISVQCLEMLKNFSLKKLTSYTDTVFGLYVWQKWIYQPENWHARCPGMVLQQILRFSKISKVLDFVKSYIQISAFLTSCFFGKIRDSHFEELLILRLLLPFICIMLKIYIFDDFSNISSIFDPKWHDIGSLKSV